MLFRLARMVLFYAALLGLWQLVIELKVWPTYIFPPPTEVWDSFRANVENGNIQRALEISLKRLAIGYSISFAIGMTVGVACGTMKWVDETVGSLVLGLQSLPSVTWLPLALLWFGLNDQAIVFVVLMGSLFAISISARDGVRNIPALQRRAAQTFGAARWQMVRYVMLPGMLPSMAQGLKLGWSFAWRSLMAAELLYVSGGIGGLLNFRRELNDMSGVVAVMLVIVAIGIVVDRIIFGPLEHWVRDRWGLAQS